MTTLIKDYYKKGEALGSSGKNRAALRILNAAVKENPKSADAHMGRGHCLMGLSKFSAATTAYKKCLFLAPGTEISLLLFRRGLLYHLATEECWQATHGQSIVSYRNPHHNQRH